jgi:hypothetical protein
MRDDRAYERLAEIVRDRRTGLGLTITAAAHAAGLSKDTFKRVENGETVRENSYMNVDDALRWQVGSCRAVLAGGDPQRLEDAAPEPEPEPITTTKIDPEDLGQALVSAMVATKGDLTAAEISTINDKVIDELKRRGIL